MDMKFKFLISKAFRVSWEKMQSNSIHIYSEISPTMLPPPPPCISLNLLHRNYALLVSLLICKGESSRMKELLRDSKIINAKIPVKCNSAKCVTLRINKTPKKLQ